MASSKTRRQALEWRQNHSISQAMGSAVKVDLLRGIETFKSRLAKGSLQEEIIRAAKTGDWRKMFKIIPFDRLESDLRPMTNRLLAAARSGADVTVNRLPEPTQRKLRYDIKNPRIADYIKNRTGELITTSEDGMLSAVRAATKRSLTHALTPDQVAGEIRGSIGLHARQVTALNSYRLALADGGHSAARQEAMVNAYSERLLDQRALMIGRTEVRFAANAGQNDVWRAAADAELIPATARRIWVVDGNPCPQICQPMNGVETGLDEPWELPDGRLVDNPTESHPNCYCIASIQL